MKKIVTIKNLISLIIIFLISSYFLINSSSINVAFLTMNKKNKLKNIFTLYIYIPTRRDYFRLEETFMTKIKQKIKTYFDI